MEFFEEKKYILSAALYHTHTDTENWSLEVVDIIGLGGAEILLNWDELGLNQIIGDDGHFIGSFVGVDVTLGMIGESVGKIRWFFSCFWL